MYAIIKNKHGIKCHIPLEFWPDWANYVSINYLGEIHFFSNKPKYNPVRKAHLTIGGRKAYWGKIMLHEGTDYSKLIWERDGK